MAAATLPGPTKLRWGELDEDDGGDDFDFLLPPRVVEGPDENGVKRTVEYRFDDEGNKVKVTTTTRVRKLARARLSKRALERRAWPKFGDAVREDVGARLTMVSTEEIVLERPRAPGRILSPPFPLSLSLARVLFRFDLLLLSYWSKNVFRVENLVSFCIKGMFFFSLASVLYRFDMLSLSYWSKNMFKVEKLLSFAKRSCFWFCFGVNYTIDDMQMLKMGGIFCVRYVLGPVDLIMSICSVVSRHRDDDL